jgi:glycosyltransferase involved in cell wall biosynthesis
MSGGPPDVRVVVPDYNAGRQLLDVLPRVAAEVGADGVLVIDDGSTDGSGEAAAAAGYTVIRHAENRGKGAALRTGFAAALERGARWVVTLDADGQHDPAEIPRFVAAAARGEHQLLVGTRMGDTRQMPPLRIFANRLTSTIISALAGQRIEDSQSGYRMIAAEVLRTVPLEFDRYEAESEILVRAARAGFSIGAVPVRTIYGEETSAIHPLVDSLRFVRLTWRLWRSC